jgi:large subunit ribosomal protein L23
MSKQITLRPRLSEKTYGLSEQRVYVIEIPKGVNKHTVARAVEAQFEVKVIKVNITNIPGKAKRTMSLTGKRAMNSEGRRTGIRKAYVTLAKGNSLPFFAAIEEEETKEQAVQEKIDKVAAKQADKQAKPRRGILPRRGGGARGGDR